MTNSFDINNIAPYIGKEIYTISGAKYKINENEYKRYELLNNFRTPVVSSGKVLFIAGLPANLKEEAEEKVGIPLIATEGEYNAAAEITRHNFRKYLEQHAQAPNLGNLLVLGIETIFNKENPRESTSLVATISTPIELI